MAAQPQAEPIPVRCTATGAKHFSPAATAEAVCARFVRTLGATLRASATLTVGPSSPVNGLVVELRFLPHGVASAHAVRLRAGRSITLPLYQMAVSDRRFGMADIDSLASDVAKGMTTVAAGD